jgi:uncharacterized protein (TIGR00251 family)
MKFIYPHPKGLVIKIFVQPRSSKNAIVGPHGDTLKIKLTAPPVAGEANRLCIKFLAKCLGLTKTSMEIISGPNNRNKQVLIHETSIEGKRQIRKRIQTSIDT